MLEGIFSVFTNTLVSFSATVVIVPLFSAALIYGVVCLIKSIL